MSFHNFLSIALVGLLAGTAAAEPPTAAATTPAATTPALVPDALAGECLDSEGHRLANVDCAELEAQLGALARIGEAQGRIEEARAKVAEAKKKRDEIEHPQPAAPAAGPTPTVPQATLASESGRLLEVIGDQARIRWRGGDYLLRPGQRLPGGAWLVQVSLDGAVIAEGKQRTTLPFVIGTLP